MTQTPDAFAAKLPAALEDLKQSLMQGVVLTVEAAVKKRTPVKIGTLRRSIASEVRSVDEGRVGSKLIYARPVNRRAQFLEHGLDDARPAIDALLADAGQAELEGLTS